MKYISKMFIIFITLFMFVFSVNALVFSNYDGAVKNTDTYITNYSRHKLYIDLTDKYLYDESGLSNKNGFVNGGFISTYEFDRTFNNNDSYLITGAKYFTMTDNGNNVDVVNLRNISSKNKSDNYESRITEYVRHFIKVKGEGTRNNPWVFVSDYTFNLNFNPMGGNVNPSSKKVTILEKYGDLPVPTKTGYNFKGWYFEDSYINEIKANDTVEITNDTTVYAKWEIKKYNVAVNVTNGSSNPNSVIVNHFDNALFNLTPNNNYEFISSSVVCNNGAKGTISGNSLIVSNITNDTTCDVNATPKYYCPVGTLKYDSSKGYICITSRSVRAGSYSCPPCYEEDYEYKCGTMNCTDYCQAFSGQNKQDCLDACWICPDCNYGPKYCTGTTTTCAYCGDEYYCPSGWSNYSGSNNNLTCYKAASKK